MDTAAFSSIMRPIVLPTPGEIMCTASQKYLDLKGAKRSHCCSFYLWPVWFEMKFEMYQGDLHYSHSYLSFTKTDLKSGKRWRLET
jgi:hypothetical protein